VTPRHGFLPLDCKFAGDRETVFYVEARTAKLADPRGHIDDIAEFYGSDEIGPRQPVGFL
jgi:hypothetical protein